MPGRPDLPDIDLALIDYEERRILCAELKWFIAPAEVREVHARHEDLAKGVSQCLNLMAAFAADPQLIAQTFGVDNGYLLSWIVVSANWIGFAQVQNDRVPIISERHFVAKIEHDQHLSTISAWLEERRYLPIEGRDYVLVNHADRYKNWTVEWYGIRGLTDDFLPLE